MSHTPSHRGGGGGGGENSAYSETGMCRLGFYSETQKMVRISNPKKEWCKEIQRSGVFSKTLTETLIALIMLDIL